MINEILLRRKNKVLFSVKGYTEVGNQKYAATMNKNIENLGFTFSDKLFNMLSNVNKEGLKEFYVDLIPKLKEKVGANVEYHPMYPNFPEQVMEMDEGELYLNAMVHYWSNGTLVPATETKEKPPLFDASKLTILEFGTIQDLEEIFINLVNSKTSLSATDKADLAWFFKETHPVFYTRLLPGTIPYKENVAYICKLQIENSPLNDYSAAYRYIKTATDVLRLAVALSDGDVSLSENCKFRSFKRSERRLIMDLLEKSGPGREEEMHKRKEVWKYLGNYLHPREMEADYPETCKVFAKLREGTKIETFLGKADKAFKEKNFSKAVTILSRRPGEYARKLDYLLRSVNDASEVINTFRSIANQVSTPVLLQVRQHFISRDDLQYRVFFPKGNLARSYNIHNELEPMDVKTRAAIVNICDEALKAQYKERGEIGKVYLSEEFKNYIAPFSQRSASKSAKTMTRGSRIKVSEEAKAVRGFIWWTNMEQGWGVDIDLTATVFDENWNSMTMVGYWNLRDFKFIAFHSGDIVNGGPIDGNGASEFLDVDIESVLENGGRYIVYQVYDFSAHGFDKLPNAMFGWMEREDVSSGEIFEPKTVVQKMDLTTKSTVCVPVIFDCLTREFIWCDMNVDLTGCRANIGGINGISNLGNVQAICYSMVNMAKPNLYDLIMLHVQGRNGTLVSDKEDADFIFDIDEGITPYDVDVFMSEYL